MSPFSVALVAALLMFSPNGNRLVFCEAGGLIGFVDLADGTMITLRDSRRRAISSNAFAPDGSVFASGNADHLVQIWSCDSGKEIRTLHDKQENGCVDRLLAVAIPA